MAVDDGDRMSIGIDDGGGDGDSMSIPFAIDDGDGDRIAIGIDDGDGDGDSMSIAIGIDDGDGDGVSMSIAIGIDDGDGDGDSPSNGFDDDEFVLFTKVVLLHWVKSMDGGHSQKE